MERLYQLVEIAATLAESLIAISAVSAVSKNKYSGAKRIGVLIGVSGLMVLTISLLNYWSAFSFVTIAFCILYVGLVTRLMSGGSLLLRMTSSIIVFLIIFTIDYIVAFGLGLVLDPAHTAFHTFDQAMAPGPFRLLFLVASKTISALLLTSFKPIVTVLRSFSKKFCGVLLLIGIAMHFIASILLNMIMSEAIGTMQTAIVMSWIFMMLCMTLILVVAVALTKQQEGKRIVEKNELANIFMAQNYQQLHDNQQKMARLIHDFNKHISTIAGLACTDSPALHAYTQELLSQPLEQIRTCQSGNDIIDAIVNCKCAEAKNCKIQFSFDIVLAKQIQISPVDICAILANQLDNAFEAVLKISEVEQRDVELKIYQKKEFVFFKVTNTVMENPFIFDKELHTTKTVFPELHGLGLRNIQETANRYNGNYEAHCDGKKFISTAFICSSIQT